MSSGVNVTKDYNRYDSVLSRTDIMMDLGESLNPAIDIGQVEGGFMQVSNHLFSRQLSVHPHAPFYKPGLRSLRDGAATPLPRGFPPNARSRRLQDPKLQRRACQVQRLLAQVVFHYHFCGSGWALDSLLISHNNDNSGEDDNDYVSFSSGGLQIQEQCTPARQLGNLLFSLRRPSSGPSR